MAHITLGTINFAIPNTPNTDEVDPHGPFEKVIVPVADVRGELESQERVSVAQQIRSRGWAACKHTSSSLSQISTSDGIEAYLTECRDLIKAELGCTRVVTWNSTCRKADNRTPIHVDRQTGPEKDFVPTDRIQPAAGFAHVDQAPEWGEIVVSRATGADPKSFRRSIIINIWRPPKGPVCNSPLAMLDFKTLKSSNTKRAPDNFGVGLHVSYNSHQRWGYIRHQMPDEIIFLLCYDSNQGRDGSALHAVHTAMEIGDQDVSRLNLSPDIVPPRESIEVRMIAVWDSEQSH